MLGFAAVSCVLGLVYIKMSTICGVSILKFVCPRVLSLHNNNNNNKYWYLVLGVYASGHLIWICAGKIKLQFAKRSSKLTLYVTETARDGKSSRAKQNNNFGMYNFHFKYFLN
jgi:hypothetical protein